MEMPRRKKDFAKRSKILLNTENNFVEILKIMSNAKNDCKI